MTLIESPPARRTAGSPQAGWRNRAAFRLLARLTSNHRLLLIKHPVQHRMNEGSAKAGALRMADSRPPPAWTEQRTGSGIAARLEEQVCSIRRGMRCRAQGMMALPSPCRVCLNRVLHFGDDGRDAVAAEGRSGIAWSEATELARLGGGGPPPPPPAGGSPPVPAAAGEKTPNG